jgi:trehalose/maltose hydrolase-like predicted phosphorylase
MLSYPSLDFAMDAGIRRRDFDYAVSPIERSHHDPNSMGLAPMSIAAATLGDAAAASAWFNRNITAHVIKPPFDVRTETAGNNTGYFLTASAGLLQNIVYGFSGLRIQPDGLAEAYAPVLPPGWKSLTLKRISWHGKLYDITVRRDASGKPQLTRTAL